MVAVGGPRAPASPRRTPPFDVYARSADGHAASGALPGRDASAALEARVLRFVAAPSASEFDDLALAIHRHQYAANAPYRRFVDRLGRVPARWTDIPAVPASAFRDSVLACAPAARVYQSSGTTQGPERRARHHVPTLAVYRGAALAGFARAVLAAGERRPFVVAAPERGTHPASSLGEMVSWLREEHDAGGPASFLGADGLDLGGLATALDAVERDRPIVLLAVTSALLRLVDHARAGGRRWQLPTGSIVVDTGGCKGYAEEVGRAEVLARYEERLGIAPDAVVNEYGMTELCSQLYARGLGPLRPPPWLRTLVCDPLTGTEQPPGTAGLLRHVDLANVGSVVAVQTEDVGRAVDGGVELLGRAPHAQARGCSLLVSA
jgi:hypothetical protein